MQKCAKMEPMIELSRFNALKYPEVKALWDSQSFDAPAPAALPDTGLIAYFEGKAVAAGFIYTTNSVMGLMEWVVTNKTSPAKVRHGALEKLGPALIALSKQLGCKALFTSLQDKSLIDRYNSWGFQETDKNMTNMVRVS